MRAGQIRATFGCLALVFAMSFADNQGPDRILASVRRTASQQLAKSANYTCVETLDRATWRANRPTWNVCNSAAEAMAEEQVMHDRLRLDLTVSRGAEVFSWHGNAGFTSPNIQKIVQGGPVSSGSFVGLMRNVFTTPGVDFAFRGKAREGGTEVVRFSYSVNRKISQLRVEGAAGLWAMVPYRGSFSADARTFELVHLKIEVDKIPSDLKICSTATEVRYQTVDIFGTRTLLPRKFELSINDDSSLHTVSRGEYSQCHEFRTESKLRFDGPDYAHTPGVERTTEKTLPSGLELQLALATFIDGKTAFAGDAVLATLTAPVQDRDGETLLPVNTVMHGVITQLSTFFVPQTYYALRIEFDSATVGARTYRLRATHQPTGKEKQLVAAIYGRPLTLADEKDLDGGTILIRSSHLRLDQRFRGEWRTATPPPAAIN